jgi:hypothetical protein
LLRRLGLDVVLTLGIYEMSETNTPGVGPVLARHGLASIPEAHCYLVSDGHRIDVTRDVVGAEPIGSFLHEEPIGIDQIGAYKLELHRRVLADWMGRDAAAQGRTLAELWAIREECIASLSEPAAVTRAHAARRRRVPLLLTLSLRRRGTAMRAVAVVIALGLAVAWPLRRPRTRRVRSGSASSRR